MKYLCYENYEDFLREYFGSESMLAARMAGVPPRLTGYYDIVRFFGEGECDPQKISIEHDTADFEFDDPLIARFAEQMASQMTKEGRLYQGPSAMHVRDADFLAGKPSILVAPCSYRLQAGSCFALDYHHKIWARRGETLRGYCKDRQKDGANRAPLATCLGISAWLTVRDGSERALLLMKRADNLASLEGTVGPQRSRIGRF